MKEAGLCHRWIAWNTGKVYQNIKVWLSDWKWLYRSGEDGCPVILLYGFIPTRSGANAADFLDGFRGYLETDGYQGDNKVSSIKRWSCWAHYPPILCGYDPERKAVGLQSACCIGSPLLRPSGKTGKQHFQQVRSGLWKKETNASREGKTGSRGLLGVGWQSEVSPQHPPG